MTSTTVVEALWLRLHPILTKFADGRAAGDPMLIRNIGRTANDAFPLRAYLTFVRQPNSAEVTITIDVEADGQLLILESGVCTDQGAVGPSVSVDVSESQSRIDAGISDWLREFEQFLVMSEPATVWGVSQLA
jgi:hypothetical protein